MYFLLMHSMAHLCTVCSKETFSLPEEKLQEFLLSLTDQNKKTEVSDQNEESLTSCSANETLCDSVTSQDQAVGGTDENINHSEESEPLSKRCKLSPVPSGSHDQVCCCPKVSCVACLGLLEEPYIQHLASTITEHVDQCSVDGMETYSLSIHVPLSLSMRRIGMEMSAKKCNSKPGSGTKLPGYMSESNYVKERLRWQLRGMLESALSPLRCDYDSPLMINLNLDHKSSLRDCIGLKKLHPKLFPRPKKRRRYQPTPITSLPIQKALEEVTEADMVKEVYFLTPISTACTHTVELQHRSVFVAGRYNKYSRKLPQTPWMVDGVRKAETSVQELICPLIVEAFHAANVRFSSSGREDVDVQMLGNGRPFLLELVNPMNVAITNVQLQRIEAEINTTSLIAVQQLRRVSKDSSILLKQGEEKKRKTYSALIWTENGMTEEVLKFLDGSKDLLITQKTPLRVLHRRTLADREKVIYSMESELLDAHHFRLKLVTQAGTYIKEFVHGDFGRTQPNVGTLLGCNADILSLDVLEVQLQWPPSSESGQE